MTAPVPGWYPDPGGTGQLRWWDGATWTDHLAPAAPSTPAPASAGVPPSAGAPPSTAAPTSGAFSSSAAALGPSAVPPSAAVPTAGPTGAWSPGPPGGGWAGARPGQPFAPPPATTAAPTRAGLVVLVAALVLGLVVIIAAVAIVAVSGSGDGSGTSASGRTTTTWGGTTVPRAEHRGGTIPKGGDAPTSMEGRAELAGIPVLDTEGAVTHTHTLVKVVGQGAEGEPSPLPLPERIGISSDQIAAVHTHDDSGIVHVESPEHNDRYTVGQLLTLWTGETDPQQICAHIQEEACSSIEVTVRRPTAADHRLFDRYGRMPDDPPVEADGLDTVLAPGAVIEIRLATG